MAQSIKNRIFGSDIPKDVKDKIRTRQKMSLANERMLEPHYGDGGIFEEIGYHHNFKDIGGNTDLSSRTPAARIWTALSFYDEIPVDGGLDTNDENEIKKWWEDKNSSSGTKNDKYKNRHLKSMPDKTFREFELVPVDQNFEQIYVVGNHVLNSEENNIHSPRSGVGDINSDIVKELLPNEQETDNNKFLKPPAGITSISSETEGSLGALKKTTINFVVHNFQDFEKIYQRYFLRPGSQIFVDFGWDTGLFYNPHDLIKSNDYNDFLYGETGMVTLSKGDLETLCGVVVNYDAKIREDGGFDCMVEIVSKNTAILGQSVDSNLRDKLVKQLDDEIIAMGVAGVTGDPSFYFDLVTTMLSGDAQILANAKNELMKLAVDAFGGFGVYLPGSNKSKLPSKYGIFVFSPEGPTGIKKIYVNYGWFEDNILNRELGFSEEAKNLNNTTKDSANIDDNNLSSKFNSKNSFITYSKSLMDRMRVAENGMDFIYPESYGSLGETYNSIRGMIPDRLDDDGIMIKFSDLESESEKTDFAKTNEKNDREAQQIPMREIFISVDIIKDSIKSATNPSQLLKNLLNKINSEAGNYIELEVVSNSYAQHTLGVTDISLQQRGKKNKDEFLESLLQFNPYSPDTIVNGYELSFTMPQGGLGNMMAIQAQSNLDDIKPISKEIDALIALDKTNRLGSKYIRTLPLSGLHASNRMIEKSTIDNSTLFGFKDGDVFFGDPNQEVESKSAELADRLTTFSSDSTAELYDKHVNSVKKQLSKFAGQAKKIDKIDEKIDEKEVDNVDSEIDFDNSKDFGSKALAKKQNHQLVSTSDEYFERKFESETSITTPFLVQIYASLKIYGISSLTPGDLIRISYLPTNYYKNAFFQITKISHDIGEQWTTSLETQMRIQPRKEIGSKNDMTNIRLKKTYLQKISSGGLNSIGKLLPYIDNIIPMGLDTSKGTPKSMNRIVYQTIINNGTSADNLTLKLPSIPLNKKVSNKLGETFNLKKHKFEYVLEDRPDLKLLGITSTLERSLTGVPKGTNVWICRSNEKWLLLPESPVNIDKWKVVDEFFEASYGIKEDEVPKKLTNEEKEENKKLEDIKETPPSTDTSTKGSPAAEMINDVLGPVGSTHTDEYGNQSSQEPASSTDYSSGTLEENRKNLISDTSNAINEMMERKAKEEAEKKEAEAYLKYLEMEYQDDFGETEEIDYSVETVEIGNSTSWDGYEDVD